MRGSFWRSLAASRPARWLFAFRGVSLGALCAACVLVSGCSLALPFGSPSVSSPPTPASALPACDAERQTFMAMTKATPSPQIGAGEHWAYQMTGSGPQPARDIWTPGETMSFLWCAIPNGVTSDTQAQPEGLTALIIGPFASRSEAQQASQQLNPGDPGSDVPVGPTGAPAGPVVASAQVLKTDTWTYADKTSDLRLPYTMKPGFYVYYTQVETLPSTVSEGGGGSTEAGVFEVRPA
jgi:hypothetical protein